MRPFFLPVASLAILAATSPAAADTPDLDRKPLESADVAKYFAPYAADVRTCYATAATSTEATGELRLELVIHRNGSVVWIELEAPGVRGRSLARLDACLRKLSAGWHFPVRSWFTSAVVPLKYQKVNVPGAGPFESCWDPKGCRGKETKR